MGIHLQPPTVSAYHPTRTSRQQNASLADRTIRGTIVKAARRTVDIAAIAAGALGVLAFATSSQAWSANCASASITELLPELQNWTPAEGSFATRFVTVGAEAHFSFLAPPDVAQDDNLVYRAFVQDESEFWRGELSNELRAKRQVNFEEITVTSATRENDGNTELTLLVPDDEHNWWKYRHFLIFACEPDQQKPAMIVASEARVSNGWISVLMSAAATLAVFLVASLGIRRGSVSPGEASSVPWRDRFNPLLLIAGPNGRASLSIFQITLFTFIVFYMLFLFLLRTGTLSELSADVALLLGIAVAGSIGGAVANQSLIGIAAANDAWLRAKGWLPPREQPPHPRFRDLITTGGVFDVYRFQTFAFNIIVAVALLVSGFSGLTTFDIPEGLLILLGLSQAAYVGGKAVTPKIATLDEALTAAREAENRLRAAVAVSHKTTPEEAKAEHPAEYSAFMKAIGDAEDLFRAIVGEPHQDWRRIPDLSAASQT